MSIMDLLHMDILTPMIRIFVGMAVLAGLCHILIWTCEALEFIGQALSNLLRLK